MSAIMYHCRQCGRRHRRSSTIGEAHTSFATYGAGIHEIPAELYHADPCERPSLSASIAKIICDQSPKHARAAHPRLNPDFARKEESRFDIGTICHALLLEGMDVAVVVDAADWRSKAAQEARDEARAAGRVPVLAKHFADVQAMYASAHEQLSELAVEPKPFTEGKPEQTLIWRDVGRDVQGEDLLDTITCRSRLDWLRDDHSAIDDYKTTSASANPERWTRTLLTIGADVQTAFYLRGLRALDPDSANWRVDVRYIVQETYAPYALSVVSCGPDIIALGEAKVDYALKVWARCLEADFWPGYPSRVIQAELPAWADDAKWLVDEYQTTVAA